MADHRIPPLRNQTPIPIPRVEAQSTGRSRTRDEQELDDLFLVGFPSNITTITTSGPGTLVTITECKFGISYFAPKIDGYVVTIGFQNLRNVADIGFEN